VAAKDQESESTNALGDMADAPEDGLRFNCAGSATSNAENTDRRELAHLADNRARFWNW
jgi:hypothetical protein